LVVVDNSPSTDMEAMLRASSPKGTAVEYIATSDNIGPAGGIRLGMERVLEEGSDGDWVLTLDDDDPPFSASLVEELWSFAARMVSSDPATAGVGVGGARFDWARGRLVEVPAGVIDAHARVDYLGGNCFPMYRLDAVRRVGPFRSDLFFGWDDLEFGLRLRRAGYALYVHGPLAREYARHEKPRDVAPAWRHYYGLRNYIQILRWNRRFGHALRVTIVSGLAKSLLNLAREGRGSLPQFGMTVRACVDSWAGRLGRTVDPAVREAA
jgi:GT2 family glycosyltransferase